MRLATNQITGQTVPRLLLFLILLAVLLIPGFSRAQEKATAPGGRLILCLIQLEHADAEYLATVLEPFLSPEGSIVPYQPTNTLIIKDRAPVVNMLSEVIKGKPCVHIPEQPEAGAGREPMGAEPDG